MLILAPPGMHYHPGDCYKCDGTGIYNSWTLYQFKFNVDNRLYTWHQPFSLLDWPVKLTDNSCQRYQGEKCHRSNISHKLIMLYIVTIYEYLKRQEQATYTFRTESFYPEYKTTKQVLEIELPYSFRECVRLGLVVPLRVRWQNKADELKSIAKNTGRAWAFIKTGKLPDYQIRELSEDEIPF